MTTTVYTTDILSGANGSFSADVSGPSPGTKYYFKAYMEVWNGSAYEEIESTDTGSFTTSAEGSLSQGYLDCYEMPAITVSGTGTSGNYSGRDDIWYKYNTGTSTRKVITHTFTGNKRVRNYTVLFDSSKHAPVWAAFPMHKNLYDGSTSRSDEWMNDPAGVSGEQTGLNNAQEVGFSRGHFVASQYRKRNDASNLQTFYYTNQAPQWQNGFNSGVWSTLEEKVLSKSPTAQGDTLYVVVGVLYEESWYNANTDAPRTLKSGSVDVPIPSHFYTCLMRCTFNSDGTISGSQGIAFVYPNVSHTGESYYSSQYVTSIAAIQQRAGFDFFAAVPDNLESSAESNTNHSWFTGVSN